MDVSANRADAGLRPPPTPKRVLVVGATGTVGRAAVKALIAKGHHVTCLVRHTRTAKEAAASHPREFAGAVVRCADVTDPASLASDGVNNEAFDAVVSCLASRTGDPQDAWAIDCKAHSNVLACARSAGVRHMVLLSAICVQKPKLAFQHAKLAFERELIESGLTYSIVRPTALFKSLSGQIERLRKGKPFLMFGDGTLTACKPISDGDLASYLVRCLDDVTLHNRILPVGGPGPAITPRQQGEKLFELMGLRPRFSRVPVALLDVIIAGLTAGGMIVPSLKGRAEFARIGRYYATESMLVWDEREGRYDEAATPSTGSEHLFDFYAQLIASNQTVDLGEHSVF